MSSQSSEQRNIKVALQQADSLSSGIVVIVIVVGGGGFSLNWLLFTLAARSRRQVAARPCSTRAHSIRSSSGASTFTTVGAVQVYVLPCWSFQVPMGR
ncbi:hypothetical protein TYRP_005425 [Tyrophagus putrescentiae]|nr:hypothetical protein TYRP_005425 [Tyrophagus putrescentiae]